MNSLHSTIYCIFFGFAFLSCSNFTENKIRITLTEDTHLIWEIHPSKKDQSILKLFTHSEISDQYRFLYPIRKLDTLDINQDGDVDIVMIITKPTHFDPLVRDRLQFLTIDQAEIKNLWMGSRTTHTFIDYKKEPQTKKASILTLEQESKNVFHIKRYHYGGFGLVLSEVLHTKKTREDIDQLWFTL